MGLMKRVFKWRLGEQGSHFDFTEATVDICCCITISGFKFSTKLALIMLTNKLDAILAAHILTSWGILAVLLQK